MDNGFSGPDRRHHTLFVTRNTEYHVRDGFVVAVRTRGEPGWLTEHKALGLRIGGRVEPGSMFPLAGTPGPGERLYLAKDKRELVTSTILSIERPARELVAAYPSLAA